MEPAIDRDQQGSDDIYRLHSSIPSLLHPRRKWCSYQFSIGFDSEQACALAAEHMQVRKKILRQDKLKYLKKSLQGWIDQENRSMPDVLSAPVSVNEVMASP